MNFESRTEILQSRVMRHLFTDAIENAQALLKRLREVEPFNVYVHERMPGILAALLVLFLISIGCVMGIVTLLPEMHWVFVLPMLFVLPVVLAGSMLTEVYVFFSWIEGRSMEKALGSRYKAARGALGTWLKRNLRVDLGPFPPVPWFLATLFVILPLVMLANTWLPAAAGFVALGILMPFIYALLDR